MNPFIERNKEFCTNGGISNYQILPPFTYITAIINLFKNKPPETAAVLKRTLARQIRTEMEL